MHSSKLFDLFWLIFSGIALGALGHLIDVTFKLDENLFFLILLPPIVFDAGYFMPVRPYFSNLGTILIYAVIGTLWNTGSIGALLYLGQVTGWYKVEFNILHCLTFSALISAVDPVAVLAVFEVKKIQKWYSANLARKTDRRYCDFF